MQQQETGVIIETMEVINSEAQLTRALTNLLKREGHFVLFFEGQRHTREIGISHKTILYATSNLLKDKLSEILFKAGKLTQDQYMLSTELSIVTKKKLGEILVKEGFATPKQVIQALNYQAKKIVSSLFEYPDWELSIRDFVPDASLTVSPQLPLIDAVVAGIRSVDNLNVLHAFLPGKDDILEVAPESQAFMQRIHFTRDETLLFDLVDGKKTFQGILGESKMLEYRFHKTLYPLVALGLLKVQGSTVQVKVEEKLAVAASPQGSDRGSLPAEPAAPPVNLQALFEEAKLLITTGEYSSAANKLKHLIRLDSKKAAYFYYLGLTLDHIPGQNKEAEKVLKIAIRLENYNCRYYLALGYLYLNRNRMDAAKKQFMRARRWDSNDPYVQEALKTLEQMEKKGTSILTKKLF